MAKKVDEQTQMVEWLRLADAAERTGKSQATIRSALRKHEIFTANSDAFREIRPMLQMPDGSFQPGGGHSSIVVRSDLLQQWAEVADQRATTQRSVGTVYKLNLRDQPLDANQIAGVRAANDQIARDGSTMTLQQAVEVLLAPFDVNLRRAFERKPREESNASEESHIDTATPNTDNVQQVAAFEFELVEG